MGEVRGGGRYGQASHLNAYRSELLLVLERHLALRRHERPGVARHHRPRDLHLSVHADPATQPDLADAVVHLVRLAEREVPRLRQDGDDAACALVGGDDDDGVALGGRDVGVVVGGDEGDGEPLLALENVVRLRPQRDRLPRLALTPTSGTTMR